MTTRKQEVDPDYEHLGCIYAVQCTATGQYYIGQASLVKHKKGKVYSYGAKGRWNDHVSCASAGERDTLINQAIQQYGENAFKLYIVMVRPLDELDFLENYSIESYRTLTPYGLNMTKGGDCRHRNNDAPCPFENRAALASYFDQVRDKLQMELDDPHAHIVAFYTGRTIKQVRIAWSKAAGCSRGDGTRPKYMAACVFIYPTDIKYAKDVPRHRFGGVKTTQEEAYAEALAFARRIPLMPGGKFDDEIAHPKIRKQTRRKN